MNLHRLQLFCQVVQTGSIAAAAEALHISRPAVSSQLRQLQEEFGVPLLERRQGRWRPTKTGEAVYGHALAMLSHAEALAREVMAAQGGVRTLVVGASPTGVLYLLTSCLRRWLDRHPDTQAHIEVDAPEAIVQRARLAAVKMAFEWGGAAMDGLASRPLGVCRFVGLVSRDHPWANLDSPVSAARFRLETLYTLYHGQGLSPVERALAAADLLPATYVRIPSVDAIKTLVAARLGTTVLSLASVQREVERGELVPVAVEGLALQRPLLAIWSPSRQLSSDEEDFLKAFEEHVQAVLEPLDVES